MPKFPPVPFEGSDESADWWVKIVGMLQQNWALPVEIDGQDSVLFVGDTSGIFDRIDFTSERERRRALQMNGFKRFADDPSLTEFISPPPFPLHIKPHPNGFIYSSGRFWTS